MTEHKLSELERHEATPSAHLDFERMYLQAHEDFNVEFGRRLKLESRCLELEAQLNSLRDAARKRIAWDMFFRSRPMTTHQPAGLLRDAIDRLQDELNKE